MPGDERHKRARIAELGDLEASGVDDHVPAVVEVSLSLFRRALGTGNPGKTGTVNVQLLADAAVMPDAPYDEVSIGTGSLKQYLVDSRNALVFTNVSGDNTTYSLMCVPVKIISGGSRPCSFTLNPKPIIDKLKSVDGCGTGRLTIDANTISFKVTGQSTTSTHRFACVEADDADHGMYMTYLAKPTDQRICATVGATSMRNILQQMDPGDSPSALGTVQLAGLYNSTAKEATIALMLEMKTMDWEFRSGFTADASDSLTQIDFKAKQSVKESADDDVEAAAERAMADDLQQEDGDMEHFHAYSKQYSGKLADGTLEMGSPMQVADQRMFTLVINEHFSPSSLLQLFKDHVQDMPNGINLIFSKRTTREQASALIVVTPLANGCLGMHMMSYCRPDDE